MKTETPEVSRAQGDRQFGSEFRRGVMEAAPFWAGVVPVGIAIGISSLTAGFSALESVGLSVFVFAGAAQITVISLVAGGAGVLAITLTVFMINLRHVIYGMSLDRQIEEAPRPPRPILAFFLVDETYGLATRDHLEGRGGHAFFLGASFSFYIVYCLATLTGVLLGSVIPGPESIGLDFIFPLMFVALLVPLLATHRQAVVAGVSLTLASILSLVMTGGITVLVATIAAASLGAALERP